MREVNADFAMPAYLSTDTQFVLQWKEFDPGAAVKVEVIFERLEKPFNVFNIFRTTDIFQLSGEFRNLSIKLVQGFDKVSESNIPYLHYYVFPLIAYFVTFVFATLRFWLMWKEASNKSRKLEDRQQIRKILTFTLVCFAVYLATIRPFFLQAYEVSLAFIFKPHLISPL